MVAVGFVDLILWLYPLSISCAAAHVITPRKLTPHISDSIKSVFNHTTRDGWGVFLHVLCSVADWLHSSFISRYRGWRWHKLKYLNPDPNRCNWVSFWSSDSDWADWARIPSALGMEPVRSVSTWVVSIAFHLIMDELRSISQRNTTCNYKQKVNDYKKFLQVFMISISRCFRLCNYNLPFASLFTILILLKTDL